MCKIADCSDRPESALKTSSAAINLLFQNLGMESPVQNRDISRLITALVKTGTSVQMKRQKPMTIEAFVTLFKNLGDNHCLSLQDLRIKAVTLLALCAMTRPSDIAPKGKLFNVESRSVIPMTMSRDDVIFETDVSMTVRFHGIKNDTKRQGFEVHIPANSENPICDPVECLRIYIE